MRTAARTAKLRWAQCSLRTAAAGNTFVKGLSAADLSAAANIKFREALEQSSDAEFCHEHQAKRQKRLLLPAHLCQLGKFQWLIAFSQ